MKETFCAALGIIGGAIASMFGGWDAALVTLVIFMAADYVSGLVVAGVFKRSRKSRSGALESRAGWKGLCKKGVTLLIVLAACRLDILLGTSFVRDTVVIAFVVNESLSIIENAGLMGVPIPQALTRAIEVLKSSAESDGPAPDGNGKNDKNGKTGKKDGE